MTYLQFLGLFLVPPLIVTAGVALTGMRRRRIAAVALGIMVIAAVLWTTPWDSWIIGHGVWFYARGTVTATVFRVPIEEYLFMAGQTVVVGLWTLRLLERVVPQRNDVTVAVSRWRPAACWLGVAVAGAVAALVDPRAGYLGTMLAWFAPLLACQQGAGADVLRNRRWARLMALVPAILYFWIADRVAVGAGTWAFSPAYTLGLRVADLPVEECVFFVMTCVLVVDGLVLAVDPIIRARVLGRWAAQ